MFALIFAGGRGTRLRDWTVRTYGEHIPKLLLPVGTEQKPFLEYNIELAKRVFDDVYLTTCIDEIAELGERLGIHVVRHPDREGRSSDLRYVVSNGFIPREDMVTINGCDIVPLLALMMLRDKRGDALLLSREYHGEFPEESIPNVVYFDRDRVTKMQREPYEPETGKALHTGVSRISSEHYDEIAELPYDTEVEQTLFQRMIDEGEMGYVLTETWLPLKTPKHAEGYQELDFLRFVES